MIYSINVFDRSRKTPQDIFFFSIASFNLSVISSVACAVEEFFQKPNWYLYKSSFFLGMNRVGHVPTLQELKGDRTAMGR